MPDWLQFSLAAAVGFTLGFFLIGPPLFRYLHRKGWYD